MATDISGLTGLPPTPGEGSALAGRGLEVIVGFAPYAGLIAGLLLVLILWLVVRRAMRKRQPHKAPQAKLATAPKDLAPAEQARIAEHERLRAAFNARQDAAAKARAELRERHFGNLNA